MNTTNNTTRSFQKPEGMGVVMSLQFVRITSLTEERVTVFVDPKEIVLASLILIINLPLLMISLGMKTLRKRKSHQLFVNVTTVHILSAVCIIASNYLKLTGIHTYLVINNALLIEMFEMLMVMSLERVMAIKYSFKYLDITSKHIVVLLVCTWILPFLYVIIGILLGLSQKASLIFSTVLISASTITLGITNLMIYQIAKRHDRFLKENARVSSKVKQNEKSLKASYTCFAIVASFMVLWTPYCVHNIVWLSGLYDEAEDGDLFSQIVDFIAYLHGIVDPLFFIWLSQATKSEIGKLLNISRFKLAKTDPGRNSQTVATTA